MPLITLGDSTKLILKIPSKGDTGWADEFKNEFAQKIVDHDHSGGGTGKKIDILNLDKVQQGVSPGNGNALIWDATDNEFKFLNPATTVSPTAFALIASQSATPGSVTTAASAIIPPVASSIPIQKNITAGVTGWFTATGKYKFATDGIFRLSTSVLVSSTRDDVAVNIIAKKVSGAVTSNIKTITKKVQSNIPVGSIIAWSAASSPGADYLRCDGSAIPISGYPDLNNVIGATYDTMAGQSAPSAGNFRVPKHDGKFLRDVGSATISDVEADATAANGLSVSEDFSAASSFSGNAITNLSRLKNVQTASGLGTSPGSFGVFSVPENGYSSYVEAGRDNGQETNIRFENDHYSRTPSGSVSTTINGGITGVSGDSETRPENTKVAYYIKAKNTVEEQIILTALVEVTANDELYIAAKASHSTGVEINFNDADTAGFTLDLEKLE